jgi:hypothetical protein
MKESRPEMHQINALPIILLHRSVHRLTSHLKAPLNPRTPSRRAVYRNASYVVSPNAQRLLRCAVGGHTCQAGPIRVLAFLLA